MLLPFSTLREEHPTAISIIEGVTGFKYDAAYGTLIKEDEAGRKNVITYTDIESFFDKHRWFLTVYPTQFPGWNGVITDFEGKHVFNGPEVFAKVNSRNHAKSLLAGIAIKMFDQFVLDMIEIPGTATVLDENHVTESARGKSVDQIQLSDFTLDGQGLITAADMALYTSGNLAIILKNRKDFPEPGLVLPKSKLPKLRICR